MALTYKYGAYLSDTYLIGMNELLKVPVWTGKNYVRQQDGFMNEIRYVHQYLNT